MTTTPPEAPPPPHDSAGEQPYDGGPRVDRDQVRDLGRLRRSITDRKVAGVAGGLGRHLDVDPLVLRIAFVVLVFFGGAGIILYGACWLLVPEETSGRAAVNLDDRSRSVALMIVGAIAALALLGDTWGAFWFPWPLAAIALLVLWLLTRGNNQARPAAPPTADVPPDPTYVPPDPTYVPPTSTYVPPPTYVSPPRRPVNPRKRGPILFWFTLALVALAEGLLGMADLAGAAIADPAYPALAVAICGVMLLVGAFYGRAGGIILLGLLATVGLVAATAADQWDVDRQRFAPQTAAALGDHYGFDVGDRVIDLTEIDDLRALDGEELRVDGDVGAIEIRLPRELGVVVDARVGGFGQVTLFGNDSGGVDTQKSATAVVGDQPVLTIDAELGVGQIEVDYR